MSILLYTAQVPRICPAGASYSSLHSKDTDSETSLAAGDVPALRILHLLSDFGQHRHSGYEGLSATCSVKKVLYSRD